MVCASVADQRCRDKLSGCSGKAIHGSWYREGSVWIQDLLVLCSHPVNSDVACDVGDQDGFIIQQVLAEPFVGPWCFQATRVGNRPTVELGHDLRGSLQL